MHRTYWMILLGLMVWSCNQKKADTPTAIEKPKASMENVVHLTAEQMKTAGIELGPIEEKNLKTSIKANGMLSVPNQNKALITSVNSGVIKTLLVQPGDVVRRGQLVATIVNPDVTRLEQELQTTYAQIHLQEVELTRQTELVAGDAAPLKNVQRVQTELVTLRSTRNSLEKQLSAMGVPLGSVRSGAIVTTMAIRAPISGTISQVQAQIGSNVDASTPIAEIVNNADLHLDLFVYEKDLPRLKARQTIHFTLTNNPGREYDAEIYSIGTAFAPETKSIPIHAIVKGDKSGLIEGMSITAVISMGSQVVPAVPTEAIVTYQGQDYIFVVSESVARQSAGTSTSGKDNLFERVGVVKGATDVGFTEVALLKNLAPGSHIITKGAFFALAKMTNTGEEQ